MNERNRILGFTRIAFMDAIVFSFLGIQFVVPPVFVVLLVIVPTIFALKVYYVTFRIVALSGLVSILLATALFGVPVGVSMCIYFVAGTMLGLAWRYRLGFVLRWLLTGFGFALALILALFAFLYLANIQFIDLASVLPGDVARISSFVGPLLACGFILYVLLLALGADRLLAQTLRQLEMVGR